MNPRIDTGNPNARRQPGRGLLAAACAALLPAVLLADTIPGVPAGAVLRNPVLNPAPFSRGTLPQTIAQLERQKAAAARERAAILAGARAIAGSGAVPAVQTPPNIAAIRVNPAAAAPAAAGGGNPALRAPAAAMGSYGSAVTAPSALARTTLPSGPTLNAAVCHGPTITSVNEQPSGVIFTPDPQYNQYTIRGCGFGPQQGQAYLYGPFVARRLNLIVEYWTDTAIIVAVDPNVTGEPDQQGTVNLAIAPASGPEGQAPGFSFFAVREQALLPSIPASWVHLAQVHDTAGRLVGTTLFTPANSSGTSVYPIIDTGDCYFKLSVSGGPAGWTLDVDRTECGRIGTGTDTLDLSNLPASLAPYAAQLSSLNGSAACEGTTYVDGSWQEAWVGGSAIQVSTQALTCHKSPVWPASGSGGTYGVTNYSLNIYVLRPRGVPLPPLQ